MWGWLAGALGSLLASTTARWVATKVIISIVVVTVLPIVLNNVIYGLLDEVLTLTGNYIGSQSAWVQDFTGLSAWFLSTCRIPEYFSIIMSAYSIRFSLNLIPFIRV